MVASIAPRNFRFRPLHSQTRRTLDLVAYTATRGAEMVMCRFPKYTLIEVRRGRASP